MITCNRCGKTLTDPISIAYGMGEVCRIKSKTDMSNEKTGNLFSNVAAFDWVTDGNIIAITDLDSGGKSVTNDIDNVLDIIRGEIEKMKGQTGILPFDNYLIMYRDTMSVWDGVNISEGRCSFFSIHETNYHKAKEKLLAKRA